MLEPPDRFLDDAEHQRPVGAWMVGKTNPGGADIDQAGLAIGGLEVDRNAEAHQQRPAGGPVTRPGRQLLRPPSQSVPTLS